MILTQLIFFLTGSWTIFTAPWASPLSNYIRRYFKLFSTFYTFSFNFLFERWAIFSTEPIFSIFRLTNLTAINPSLNLTIYYRLCFLKLFTAKSTNSFNFLTIKTLFAAIFSRTLLNSRRKNFEFSSTSFTNSFYFAFIRGVVLTTKSLWTILIITNLTAIKSPIFTNFRWCNFEFFSTKFTDTSDFFFVMGIIFTGFDIPPDIYDYKIFFELSVNSLPHSWQVIGTFGIQNTPLMECFFKKKDVCR